jgi:hypothetical protein
MDKGKVAEFDTPHNLLSDQFSSFSRLVDETSLETAKKLRAEAEMIHWEKARTDM